MQRFAIALCVFGFVFEVNGQELVPPVPAAAAPKVQPQPPVAPATVPTRTVQEERECLEDALADQEATAARMEAELLEFKQKIEQADLQLQEAEEKKNCVLKAAAELKAAIAAASNPDLQTDLEERQKEFVAAAGASPQNSTEVEKTRTAFFAAKERLEEAKSKVDFLKGKLSAENGLSSSGDILVALETKETEYDEKISDLKSEIANNEKICAEKAQCIVTLERKATKIANQLERLDRLESIELQRKAVEIAEQTNSKLDALTQVSTNGFMEMATATQAVGLSIDKVDENLATIQQQNIRLITELQALATTDKENGDRIASILERISSAPKDDESQKKVAEILQKLEKHLAPQTSSSVKSSSSAAYVDCPNGQCSSPVYYPAPQGGVLRRVFGRR